ncbi:MAG: f1pep1 [Labilithrix sp.]|nr:f1pep1 [Labilithrix sp.]
MQVADPFRPLEQLDAPATRAWVAAENELTSRVLADLPARASYARTLGALSAIGESSAPVVRGGRWFWRQDDGVKPQSTLVVADGENGAPRTLVDPQVLSPDGKLSFTAYEVAGDGSRVAYGLASGGGDWTTWHLRDVATGRDLPEALPWLKYYPPQLTRDGKVVYYSRFPAPAAGKELSEPDHDHKVYRHVVGTDASADVVVYERPDHPTWQFRPHLTGDGRYLVLETGDGEVGDRSEEELHVLDLSKPAAKPVPLATGLRGEYLFVGNEGATFYVQTNEQAPNRRIVSVDLSQPEPRAWRDVLVASADNIDSASLVGHRLLVEYVHDARTRITVHDTSGKQLGEVPLPGASHGSLGAPDGEGATAVSISVESFARPRTAFRYDLGKATLTPFRPVPLPYAPDDYETTLSFYAASDGTKTKIPLSVTAKKGAKRGPSTKTLLTGYGVGGVPYLPVYRAMTMAWLEQGGALAVANVRGGGEYGDAWRLAGSRENKHVSHEDFIAAAEQLVAQKVTSPKHLGIFGRSGGGLLVAAVLVKRPDLFGAVAPIVGVHDAFRFQLFGEGAGWTGFMGSLAVPAEAKAIRDYSPLHNVARGTKYPPTYLLTSDHDVRVAPLHSYKLAAALQDAQAAEAPILLRVSASAGHGGATTRAAKVESDAELLGFFARYLE